MEVEPTTRSANRPDAVEMVLPIADGLHFTTRFPCILANVCLCWLFVVVLLITGYLTSIALAGEPCDTPNSSQREMERCYGNAYKESDAKLNALYTQIEDRLKDDQNTAKLLVSAQRAWLAFRDGECGFSTSDVSGGTLYPMIYTICLDRLTRNRIEDFKTYLNCRPGALDCPVPVR